MPYRQNGRDRWLVSTSHRGRVYRLSTGTPIEATATRYETVLREVARHDHVEVLEALHRREVSIAQVARWWGAMGDRGLLGELRRWQLEQTEGRSLRPLVAEWIAERQDLGTPSAATLNAYRACLERAIPKGMTARELDREAVVTALRRGPNSRKMAVALTRWTKWLRGRGVLTSDPMVDVPMPPAGKPRDRWLSQEGLVNLLRAADEKYRDAILLAYGTGIDRETLVKVTPSDVNEREHTILARGTKTTQRERRVLVADFAWPAVERLLAARRRKPTLLPPMTGWALSKAHRRAAEAIGEHGLQLKDARHTLAVRLSKSGAPPQVVAAQLGNSVEMVVKVYSKYMPSLVEQRHWESRATANGW